MCIVFSSIRNRIANAFRTLEKFALQGSVEYSRRISILKKGILLTAGDREEATIESSKDKPTAGWQAAATTKQFNRNLIQTNNKTNQHKLHNIDTTDH